MHRSLTDHGYPAHLEAAFRTLPLTIAAPAAARMADAADVDALSEEARLAGDDTLGVDLYNLASGLHRSREVDAAVAALEGGTLGPCGCTDYHMSDCPTRG